MIVASLLLILVAVVLLVLGLAEWLQRLLIISIAASLLAAVALWSGARQAAADRAMAGRGSGRPASRPTHPARPAEAAGVASGPPLVEPDGAGSARAHDGGTGGPGGGNHPSRGGRPAPASPRRRRAAAPVRRADVRRRSTMRRRRAARPD